MYHHMDEACDDAAVDEINKVQCVMWLVRALLRSHRCSFIIVGIRIEACHTDNMLDICVTQVATQCRKVTQGGIDLHARLPASIWSSISQV